MAKQPWNVDGIRSLCYISIFLAQLGAHAERAACVDANSRHSQRGKNKIELCHGIDVTCSLGHVHNVSLYQWNTIRDAGPE